MGETALGSFYPYPNIKVTTMIVGILKIVKLYFYNKLFSVAFYWFGEAFARFLQKKLDRRDPAGA